MSTVNLSDLMRELQAGEEARAQVPSLQADCDRLQNALHSAQFHSQELETSIIDYKRTIDGLNAKVRSLEVERDDAGFRELETQDKLTTLLNAFRGVQHDIGETILHVDPPKPEPVVEKPAESVPMTGASAGSTNVPITDHGGERVADPTASAPSAVNSAYATEPSVGSPSSSSDQRDPLPSAPSTAPIQPSASGADVKSPESAGSTINIQRYLGRPYSDKPWDVSWNDWMVGGGEKAPWL